MGVQSATARLQLRYGVSILSVIAAAALRLELVPELGTRAPFVTFFPAVVVAAVYGGLWPGLLSVGLSGLAASYWIEPVGHLGIRDAGDWSAMVVFLGGGVAVSLVCEAMHRARARAAALLVRAELAEERQKAQEALGRYELLARNTRDIILFVRMADGHILEANEAAERAYGRPREELLGLTVFDLRAPEHRRSVDDQMSAAATSDIRFETVHCRRNGETFPVEVSSHGDTIGGERILLSIVRDITDRKRAEGALRESEENLRAILDTAPESVLLFTVDDVILSANSTAACRLGMPPGEITGKIVSDLLPPDIRDARKMHVQWVLDTGKPMRYEDESAGLVFEHYISPILDSEARVARIVTFSRDITDVRRAERALSSREREFETLVERAPDVIMRFDRQLRHLYVNPAMEAGSGMSRSALLGQTSEEVGVPPEQFAVWSRNLRQVFDVGAEVQWEHSYHAVAGLRHYHTRAVPEMAPDGTVETVITVSRDITDLKTIERDLRSSEERYRSLFNGMTEGFALQETICDGSGDPVDYVFLDVNPAFERMTGLHRGELVGKRVTEALPDRDPKWIRILGELSLTGQTARLEHVAPSDQRNYEVFAFSPAPGQSAVLISDITDRKLRAQAQAEADRAKDEFLAMLSHELRNPLGAISYAAKLLELRTAGQEQLHKPAEILGRQVRHTVRLVDDLLDVSRITQGKLELRQERVDLAAVARRAVEVARPQMEEVGHAFTVALPDEPVWLYGDPARLEQVVGNLLNNAGKYTESGGTVSLIVSRENGDAVLRVTDDGCGISPEMLPRVFDLFAQEDRTLARSHGGLGIGLSLVKTLVEMHHGVVSAASGGTGQGSEFTVRLPLETSAEASPAASTPGRPAVSRRVLVVDDNADAAQMLGDILEILGHTASLAYDGPSAIEAVRLERPDVVLLDIGLPGMDGYEVARCLRSAGLANGMRLVALTGYGQEEDLIRSHEAGFDAHMLKPVDIPALGQFLGE
ncbi:MAG TPA: PAS domain S-box protein [Armatimonadota bacterium]|jgi:PAS domain S-box-containing protein